MNKKTDKKKVNGRKPKRPDGVGGNNSAQNSEYRDLRKRVTARKDGKAILDIARKIEKIFEEESEK